MEREGAQRSSCGLGGQAEKIFQIITKLFEIPFLIFLTEQFPQLLNECGLIL